LRPVRTPLFFSFHPLFTPFWRVEHPWRGLSTPGCQCGKQFASVDPFSRLSFQVFTGQIEFIKIVLDAFSWPKVKRSKSLTAFLSNSPPPLPQHGTLFLSDACGVVISCLGDDRRVFSIVGARVQPCFFSPAPPSSFVAFMTRQPSKGALFPERRDSFFLRFNPLYHRVVRPGAPPPFSLRCAVEDFPCPDVPWAGFVEFFRRFELIL